MKILLIMISVVFTAMSIVVYSISRAGGDADETAGYK